jgi:hypothetical protein
MQRLHSRGPSSRGIVVDRDGAMLGPDCPLVLRTTQGYRPLDRANADMVQAILFSYEHPDWLFGQCRRIADALERGELAFAQILGLHLPIGDLDDRQLRHLSRAADLTKAGYNPDEPRVPAGNPDGGQWTDGEGDEQTPAERDTFDPNAVIPVADFSGGFHDEVVKAWLDTWDRHGIPAVAVPAIRFIGPDGRVQGYPDVLIHEPGQAIEAFEIKTGSDPTFTSQQARYIPMLQLGRHVYSNDSRIEALGLRPGVPFPPMRVGVIYAPGPGQRYVVRYLSGPFYGPE